MKENRKVDFSVVRKKLTLTRTQVETLFYFLSSSSHQLPFCSIFYLNPLMVQSLYALTCSMFALVTIDNLISNLLLLNTIRPLIYSFHARSYTLQAVNERERKFELWLYEENKSEGSVSYFLLYMGTKIIPRLSMRNFIFRKTFFLRLASTLILPSSWKVRIVFGPPVVCATYQQFGTSLFRPETISRSESLWSEQNKMFLADKFTSQSTENLNKIFP